jgi:hypothetical protein
MLAHVTTTRSTSRAGIPALWPTGERVAVGRFESPFSSAPPGPRFGAAPAALSPRASAHSLGAGRRSRAAWTRSAPGSDGGGPRRRLRVRRSHRKHALGCVGEWEHGDDQRRDMDLGRGSYGLAFNGSSASRSREPLTKERVLRAGASGGQARGTLSFPAARNHRSQASNEDAALDRHVTQRPRPELAGQEPIR